MSLAAPGAGAQNVQHFYELGVEVNGSAVRLTIYKADTGELLWGPSTISETGGTPDKQFDTNGSGGPGITYLPSGVLVLAFTPVSCDAFSTCTPLTSAITYAWAGNPNPVAPGSFYRPAVGTGLIDTNFSLNNGAFDIHTHDSGLSGFINTTLGERGWTLPYDRTTLCAAVTCNGDGPSSQFFSAGVSTVAPPGHPTWRQLVPTFAFKGTVAPLATWGTLTWNVPNLALQFVQGAKLDVNSTLNASGTLLTAANATSGWGGIRVTGAAHTSFDGITIEKVSAASGAGAALTYLDSEPDIGDSIIRDAIGSGVDGIYLGGAAQVGTIENVFVQNVTGDGIGLSGEFDYLRFIGNTVVNNSGHGFSFGYRSGGFLGNNLSQNNGGHGLSVYAASVYLDDVYNGSNGDNRLLNNITGGVFSLAGAVVRGGRTAATRGTPSWRTGSPAHSGTTRRATPRKAPTPGRATRGPWPTSSATGGGGPPTPTPPRARPSRAQGATPGPSS